MPQDLHGRRVDFRSTSHVSHSTANSLKKHSVRSGDILYARRGNVDECVLIPEDHAAAICGTGCMLVRIDSKCVNNEFLFYNLQLSSTKAWIRNHAIGATMPNLNTEIVSSIPVELPSLPDQRAIAEVLGALDDKIAANRKLHSAAGDLTCALFRKSTVEAPVGILQDFAKINAHTVKPGQGMLSYIDIASVSEGSYSPPRRITWTDAPGRARRGTKRGDTIWSTVRPNRRSHALILRNDLDLVASTGLVTLTPRHQGFSYLYEATRTPAFTEYLVSNAKGSAYPAVTGRVFTEAPVPNLPAREVDSFNAACDPIWERAELALQESETLAELRDTLLPALMDGTIRVKDAETHVEEVL